MNMRELFPENNSFLSEEEQGELWDKRIRLITKDISLFIDNTVPRWFHLPVSLLENEEGKPKYFIFLLS